MIFDQKIIDTQIFSKIAFLADRIPIGIIFFCWFLICATVVLLFRGGRDA